MAARKSEKVEPLSQFENHDVLASTVAITNAGDGLSKALAVSPQELHFGDKVYVVLECEMHRVRFDPIKDTQALARVHVLRAGTASLVDEKLVREVLDATEEAIERAQGVVRLPLGATDPDPADQENG